MNWPPKIINTDERQKTNPFIEAFSHDDVRGDGDHGGDDHGDHDDDHGAHGDDDHGAYGDDHDGGHGDDHHDDGLRNEDEHELDRDWRFQARSFSLEP